MDSTNIKASSVESGLTSVMMPVYNAGKYIGQAIASLLNQKNKNWELIVVNDGSTDNTDEVISRYRDNRIKLIVQQNSGEGFARNIALENSIGEFIAFLDADDMFLPQHLELSVAYLQKNLDVDGVYSNGYYCDPFGVPIQTLTSRRRGPYNGRIFDQVVRASDVFGPPISVVLRHDLILKYGLRFDPRIVIGPDWDFFIRYSEHATFSYIDDVTCIYRLHQNSISSSTKERVRRSSLALCREKAIHLKGFPECSLDTRYYTFYDLLINLLVDDPKRQNEIIRLPQFKALPLKSQAKLLRLAASASLLSGNRTPYIKQWLMLSATINPFDIRSLSLNILYFLNPSLCYHLLTIKRGRGISLKAK